MPCAACGKVKGAIGTIYQVARGAVTTGTISNPLIGKQRLEICEKCPSFKPQGRVCNECGCYMEIKAPLIAAKCPKGMWKR